METRSSYFKTWEALAADKGMVFMAGPRQAGKTTLAKIIAAGFANSLYFNWDIPDHRARLLQNPSFFTALKRRDDSKPFIIFDEIHKVQRLEKLFKGRL
jgi:predicted AAA+ superfamily ATPase